MYLDHKQVPRLHTYEHVEFDQDGYADNSLFEPLAYDLLYLKGNDPKVHNGWWTGKKFDGLKLPKDFQVLNWKRNMDEY